ncbi:MAG: menaquinone biosynthesis decarboxylase [Elusimicrobia bacterium]|nr:menaquinone biosynthesis decarboxylase [Elusimicrobiota bacterium]
MKIPNDLPDFIRLLERSGELKRVRVEVDPALEITEIATRVVKAGGPALYFEKIKGSPYPVVINLFGSERRMEMVFGRPPAAIGEELRLAAEDLFPPAPSSLWRHRSLLMRASKMSPRQVARGPATEVTEAPDLDAWPLLTCWPEDGGRFFTLPLVITQNPARKQNVGMYRLQAFDKTTTGMHMQIERGGGAHYAEWEARGEAMPTAVALGGDPVTILSSVLPLPENMDEFAFAGFLRGEAVPLLRLSNGVLAPANAEFILEGFIPPKERRTEGPFGDHFGHYSHAAPYPVFHVQKVHRRKNPIYPATVVGKPPQEDKFMGNAINEMLIPLLKTMRPELKDLWTYQEAGFHNLAVAAVKQRYAKEAVKTALGLMGQGQMSLTKCVVLVDPGVNVKSFNEVLDAVRKNFRLEEDFILLPGTAQDTLDFTSFKMNLGSKMILDATTVGKKPTERKPVSSAGPSPDGNILQSRLLRDALLVVQMQGPGRPVIERLVRDPALSGFPLIAAVSADVPLDDEELLIWGLFTRFDCARDLVPGSARLDGAWPKMSGPLGIDATWKPGYPNPLVMDPSVVEKVTQRWGSYGL